MRTEAEDRIAAALQLLYRARDQLKLAKAPKATAKVRAAITSTQGAARHASHAATREAEQRPMRRTVPLRYAVTNADPESDWNKVA